MSLSAAGIAPMWATPAESVWADIETVALRVMVTLHWATQDRTDLLPVLTQLVLALLAGHVMDQKLDMTNVLKLGLASVLTALCHTQIGLLDMVTATRLRHLTSLFLRRLTTDRGAFQALYGDRVSCTAAFKDVLEEARALLQYAALKPLWCLLCELLFSVFCCLLSFAGATRCSLFACITGRVLFLSCMLRVSRQ